MNREIQLLVLKIFWGIINSIDLFALLQLSMAAVKSVLITGCSKGGIGDALAMAYHRQGLRVFATARTLSKVEHLKQMGIELVPLDVIDQSSISQAVEIIRKATGGTLDILVNNSGSGMVHVTVENERSLMTF